MNGNDIDELIAHLATQRTTRAVDALIAEIERLRQEIKRLEESRR